MTRCSPYPRSAGCDCPAARPIAVSPRTINHCYTTRHQLHPKKDRGPFGATLPGASGNAAPPITRPTSWPHVRALLKKAKALLRHTFDQLDAEPHRAKLDPVLDAVGDKTTRRRSARRRSSRRGVGIQALCPRRFGRRPGRTILNAGSTWEPSAGSLSGPPWSESSNPRSPCQPARVGSAYVFGGTSSVSIGSPR